MLASHVAAVRAWWFHSCMGEGGPELDALADFDEGEESEQRTAPEIVAALAVTWSLVDSCLHRWSEADAFRRLQRAAMNCRRAMVDLAQDVLNGVEVDL